MKKFSKELFTINDHVLVALSGGADSVSCLHFLLSLCNVSISAFHLNHSLREESSSEQNFCHDFCQKKNIMFYTKTADILKESKLLKKSIEETGRIFRYRLLEETAKEIGANIIVTAHHQGDQTESILMQFLSGSSGIFMGIKREWIRDKVKIIRPMLEVSKSEIYAYCEENKLQFCEDSSNLDVNFTRNKLRQVVIPLIKNSINPALDNTLSRHVRLTNNLASYLEKTVDKSLEEISSLSKYSISQLHKLDIFIQCEVIKRLLLPWEDLRITSSIIEEVLSFLSTSRANSQMKLSSNLLCLKEYDIFFFTALKSKASEDNLLISFGENIFQEFSLTVQEVSHPLISKENNEVACLDLEKIDTNSLHIRVKKVGDKFIPLGMSHFKKLKDYFIDKKIPTTKRKETHLLCDKDKIIWIIGHEIDNRVKIDVNSKKYLYIKYTF